MADFDPTKPVQTRSGNPAEIKFIDDRLIYPIVAVVAEADSFRVDGYTADGRYFGSRNASPNDLVNVPQRHMLWVNFYRGPSCSAHVSQGRANDLARPGRIACIRVEFEEGEGLDDG